MDKDYDRQIVFLQFLLQPFSLASGDKRLGPIEITGIIIGTILVAVTIEYDKLNLVPYEGINKVFLSHSHNWPYALRNSGFEMLSIS